MKTFHRVRAWGNEPSQTKKKWVVGVNLALTVLYIGGGVSVFRYIDNREVDACQRRVESREEIRGMFQTTFDVIEESSGPSTTLDAARLRLDERYPPLSPEDC